MIEDTNLDQLQDAGEIDAPDEPGPTLLGRTPVAGTLRRNYDLPVLRDELDDF